MNLGFKESFKRNDYCGLVNTDMFFGKDWLKNLVKHASENIVVNATHITPITGTHVITADLGIPTYNTFQLDKFNAFYDMLFEDKIITEEDRDGKWVNVATMPYLYHRKWWKQCGPWELQVILNHEYPTPDRRFWQRCSWQGAKFIQIRDSIVYHHERVERERKRPKGAEHLANER
jgi:GT2 family glycosyltransferase